MMYTKMEKYNLYYIIITLQCDIYYFLEYREMSINKIRFMSFRNISKH